MEARGKTERASKDLLDVPEEGKEDVDQEIGSAAADDEHTDRWN
jgi:hypothetical protein